ncbi:YHYH protein [Ruegeria sp. Alg231-54]|uniref:YHYH protein n=1 Tax=Ruegeria sp. Alg231-54 TaxID=1922221 RepID=UPI000D557334|nr:YHYH protein [Ruegeria sp. Alg231-54]
MTKTVAVWSVAFALSAVAAIATAQHSFRYHDETETQPLLLQAATVDPGHSHSEISETRKSIRVSANGIPDHLVGSFPNQGNPHSISQQRVNLKVPTNPKSNRSTTPLEMGWNFGVSLNGVVFDPLAAEFWQGNPRSGWSYNALGGAVTLGFDENYAHVQPNGKYHYHGIPTGFIELLNYTPNRHSPLIGYAADGFPIYAMTGVLDGKVTQMKSSYRLKSGNRPGGNAPDGKHDGTFNEDYANVAGAGNLDECNGAFTVSPEYPSGTYAYFLTESYPVIPRCFAGKPDNSFRFGRR